MTINAPASVLLLLYQLVAEEQGVAGEALRGTVQNDVLKEYIARGTYIFPPAPSLRLVSDTFAYCARAPAALEHHLGVRLPHGRGGGHARAGGRLHPRPTGSPTWRPRCAAGLGVDRRRAPAVVLLRRADHAAGGGGQVPGRPPGVGAHRRATGSAATTRARRCCASTPRPPGCSSPPSSRRSTWSGSRCRRSVPCWVARRACTRTPTTRRSRCRARRRPGWPCAPSR